MMDTKELKRLAEAATPGPWRATQNYVIAEETPDRLGFRLSTRNFNGNRDDGRKFGAYIAAANPAVVLALIARITELEAAAGAPDLRSAIPDVPQEMLTAAMRKAVALELFPKHADAESYLKLWDGMKQTLAAALASAAPVEALTDEEIVKIGLEVVGIEPGASGGYFLPVTFARAIEARIMGGVK